ncbi:hypothetical protein CDD83_5739 [Cordyceps sp. RAO-2017]|nr:hypothetical protein CDD83_5739 [Cordyceps sp. RAO-2017]
MPTQRKSSREIQQDCCSMIRRASGGSRRADLRRQLCPLRMYRPSPGHRAHRRPVARRSLGHLPARGLSFASSSKGSRPADIANFLVPASTRSRPSSAQEPISASSFKGSPPAGIAAVAAFLVLDVAPAKMALRAGRRSPMSSSPTLRHVHGPCHLCIHARGRSKIRISGQGPNGRPPNRGIPMTGPDNEPGPPR